MSNAEWLIGGGEMGKLIRSMDWSPTPLGAIETWPQSLRTTVSLCVASNFPISIAWGPKHTQLYNDGYWPICGGKHPRSMGQDFSECWASAMPVIGEAFARALGGEASYLENQRMYLDRNGYLEETFFTFSFSPIRDETGGVGGLFHPVTETTSKMLSERRTKALRDLAARTGKAKSLDETFAITAQTLGEYELDLPFVLIYRIDETDRQAQLLSATGLASGTKASPQHIDLQSQSNPSWPLYEVLDTGTSKEIDNLEEHFGPLNCGPYEESPKKALLMPITPPGAERPLAIVIAGISSRLPLNEMYRSFYDLLTSAITAAIANACAYEEERKRAEALAELDRAKTAFFSNVSHEFRTPLTLMLGPVEDTLTESEERLPPRQRERLEVAHRNALRLQKLVNSLLDFSRIEAGRVQVSYEPTDLAMFTTELASNFRSACEKAGLELEVNCPTLPDPVYVDRDMWEKIILNLLSNAFKFTWVGQIEVSQRIKDDRVELLVRDTGTGVPAEELPRLFERFHRIERTKGRTQEGSGIGLALVRELVHLHGGEVTAESTFGEGSCFTVSIPLGKDHLPADRIAASRSLASTAIGAAPFVEEALRWLPDPVTATSTLEPTSIGTSSQQPESREEVVPQKPSRILLADDNADMRNYVRRLLSDRYEVVAVENGESALRNAIENPPDLILSDVMMPGLDGFALLSKLRENPTTQELPVLLLSARAGEEARVQGLEAGADDYIVKPFSARELLARVASQLDLAKLRRETSEALRQSEEQLREADRRKDDFLATLAHELRNPLAPLRNGLEVIRLAGHDEQMVEETRCMMERQLKNMVRLIDDLLDVSRITRNKLELRKKRVELTDIIQAAVETAQPLINEGGHRLSVSLPQKSIQLDADPMRLAQVFSNLLTNAAKYTEYGGDISLTTECQEDNVSITVSDTGIGIAEEHVPKLFEMFSQVTPALDRSQGGLGIGLSLVDGLVKMHGGSVKARSDGLGQGSEFVVQLPILLDSIEAQKESFTESSPSKNKVQILVVDDNKAAAKMIALTLKLQGHEVYTAHDGEEAVIKADEIKPDVILLDIGLPKLNGYDACRRIREHPTGKSIKIIALTGWGQEEDKRKAVEAGFDHHCTKPVDMKSLLPLLT